MDYLTEQRLERFNRPLPIALAVELNPRAEIKTTKNGSFQVTARPNRCPEGDNAQFRVRPVLYFTDRSLAESIARQAVILVALTLA